MTTAYNSNAVPFGGIFANFYRNEDTPALLGSYLVETISPADAAVGGTRPAVDGGDNGWWLVPGITEGPATIQLATTATPTLKNGDFCKLSAISVDATGTPEQRYFVVMNPSPAIATTEYRKQSVTLREDKYPTAAVQAITGT